MAETAWLSCPGRGIFAPRRATPRGHKRISMEFRQSAAVSAAGPGPGPARAGSDPPACSVRRRAPGFRCPATSRNRLKSSRRRTNPSALTSCCRHRSDVAAQGPIGRIRHHHQRHQPQPQRLIAAPAARPSRPRRYLSKIVVIVRRIAWTFPRGANNMCSGGFEAASASLPFFLTPPSRSACVRRSVICAKLQISNSEFAEPLSSGPVAQTGNLVSRAVTTRAARAWSSGVVCESPKR